MGIYTEMNGHTINIIHVMLELTPQTRYYPESKMEVRLIIFLFHITDHQLLINVFYQEEDIIFQSNPHREIHSMMATKRKWRDGYSLSRIKPYQRYILILLA